MNTCTHLMDNETREKSEEDKSETMPPREGSPLLSSSYDDENLSNKNIRHRSNNNNNNNNRFGILPTQFSFGYEENNDSRQQRTLSRCKTLIAGIVSVAIVAYAATALRRRHHSSGTASSSSSSRHYPAGPYKLRERHVGKDFANYYTFFDGPDSLGSAGYNTYVGQKLAVSKGLFNVTEDKDGDSSSIYIQSSHVGDGKFRESVRLEGKKRYDHGLFIIDIDHMPTGCGVWPAFWMTDEKNWPNHGEIDIVEGINDQSVVKTALHTSDKCDMYAHVSDFWHTGHWDRSTGIPDTYTGKLDTNTSVPADNCWVNAPHQWANQGCVAVHPENGTLGAGINEAGGAVYVLEWDPANQYIRSWVFRKDHGIPANLHDAISSTSGGGIRPDPMTWGLPYAYFAVGEKTGCSADHFQNMRIVLNLAFCGTVAGNRFGRDCPALLKKYAVKNPDNGQVDPVLTCNAYVGSNPKALDEAYWKIRGVYVYERENHNSTRGN